MKKPTDIRVVGATLYFLPVQTRVPLKFGSETLTEVTCARVRVRVTDRLGKTAEGWGETPLSTQWVWPSTLPLARRTETLKQFCIELAHAWAEFAGQGHPMEVGHDFQHQRLPALVESFHRARSGFSSSPYDEGVGRGPRRGATPTVTPTNSSSPQPSPPSEGGEGVLGSPRGAETEPMPWLAALVCCSAFDLAVHDAFGQLRERPTYSTYNAEFMNRSLGDFLEASSSATFAGRYPQDFLLTAPPTQLPAWHLVGGLDLLDSSELKGDEPQDGYPVLLPDWIRTDGLRCLKVKLRGTDAAWDYARMVRVGEIARAHGVEHLSADFNCTVTDPAYVCETLDRLKSEHPRIFDSILYVEQPFPYDLEKHRIDVHSVSARKPLFLDESAHDWRIVRLGRNLGWNGVALKTCKTQTGALLTACWAKAHGMQLMVQDLTNPMLAQIPHVLLAAHVGTIMGVETNGMQFYPAASAPEAAVHPGIYQRRNGAVDLASIRGAGLGYRLGEIERELPVPEAQFPNPGASIKLVRLRPAE